MHSIWPLFNSIFSKWWENLKQIRWNQLLVNVSNHKIIFVLMVIFLFKVFQLKEHLMETTIVYQVDWNTNKMKKLRCSSNLFLHKPIHVRFLNDSICTHTHKPQKHSYTPQIERTLFVAMLFHAKIDRNKQNSC